MHTATLSEIPLFACVPRGRQAEVGRAVDELSVPEGTTVIRQGDLAHEFFVLLDGTAEVVRDGRHVATLTAGDFFGEIALVGAPFRTASVIAQTDVDLAVVTRREFRTLIRRFPDLASIVLAAGSRRVVSTLREVEASA